MSDILAGIETEQWLMPNGVSADYVFENELLDGAKIQRAEPILQGHAGLTVDNGPQGDHVTIDLERYVDVALGNGTPYSGAWHPSPFAGTPPLDSAKTFLNGWMRMEFPRDPELSAIGEAAITIAQREVFHEEMLQRLQGRLGANEGLYPIEGRLTAGLLSAMQFDVDRNGDVGIRHMRHAVEESAATARELLTARTVVVNHETADETVQAVDELLQLPRPLEKYRQMGWTVLLQETPWDTDSDYHLAFVRPTVDPEGYGDEQVVLSRSGNSVNQNLLPHTKVYSWVIKNDHKVDRLTDRMPLFVDDTRSQVVRFMLNREDLLRGAQRDFRLTAHFMHLAGIRQHKVFRR